MGKSETTQVRHRIPMRRKLQMLCVLFLAIILLMPASRVSAASKIGLSAKTAKITAGKTKQLALKKGTKKITKGIKWKTSDKTIVGVTQKGKIKGKSIGTAKITAVYKNKRYVCKVTVKAPNYKISAKKKTLTAGKTFQLNLMNGTKKVTTGITWQSDKKIRRNSQQKGQSHRKEGRNRDHHGNELRNSLFLQDHDQGCGSVIRNRDDNHDTRVHVRLRERLQDHDWLQDNSYRVQDQQGQHHGSRA